eukprot:TRINITY_DN6293_c0_g1_i7.p1 TRINITY_DN6293_c0_g1~~TRINITY_DN6293_c0_g1_i7.p1  ORF type:complete len:218 (-),score=52.35 TRINITY_DN6293_c0_g1_i7:511-1164(-)
MGIWDLLYSATDKLKQNVPDLTPVTNACQNSYRVSGTVASNVYKAITVDGVEKVKDYLPGPQSQEKIKRIAKEVAVPEMLRFTGIPGLAKSYRILLREDPLSSSVHDSKKFEQQAKELKEMQMKNEELWEEFQKIKQDNKILREHILGDRIKKESLNDSFHLQFEEIQKPEEVIMDFLANGFKGHDLLCPLVAPKAACLRKHVLESKLDGRLCHLLE